MRISQILTVSMLVVGLEGCQGIATALILHPININRCKTDSSFRARHLEFCNEYAPMSAAPAKTPPAQNNIPGESPK